MKKITSVTFLFILLFASSSYGSSNLFYPPVYFATGSPTMAVAIGDVNGDGRNDVVITTSYSSNPENDYKIYVFLQNQSGQLDPPIKTNSSINHFSTSINIGDVNHDGRADVVVGNQGTDIQVFLQNASGTLDPGISYPTSNSYSVRIADLNNDGLLDVVGIGVATNSVDVFLQNTNGTLNPPISYNVLASSYREVDVGDLNNDGLTDIIIMDAQGLIGVLTQRPDGIFNPAVYYEIEANEFTSGIAVGDLNGDNLQDVVISYGGNQPSSKIGGFFQNTGGTLDPVISYQSYDIPNAVIIADLDNGGKKDIIVDHGTQVGVYFQGEAGTISPEELYPNLLFANYYPQNLAVGDINGDGLNDIVRATASGLEVLYSLAGPAIPDISVSPSSVNYGSIFLLNTSSQTVTIYNRGTGILVINSISITGQNASEFGQTNDCSTVGPGDSCHITATFTAMFEGAKNATLTIFSNDPDTPTVDVTFFAYAGANLFGPNKYFYTGSWPEAVGIGDVNGDGRNDVVMTTGYYFDPENDYQLFVFLQNASGELNPPVKYPTNSSFTNRSESIGIGDVNHDGRADVVIGNCGSNIQVFIQNDAGSLDPGISYFTINSCGIRIGDLNNDGLLDVVGIGRYVEVFLQNGNGTLNSYGTYTVDAGGPTELEVGDVNNDALTDIIVMSASGPYPNISILFQNPNGTFSGPVSYDLGGGEWTEGVAVGDINGDGLNDIVVSYTSQTFGIGVFLQNNTGTLNPALFYSSFQNPEAVVLTDVIGDGRKDVVVGRWGWFGVYLQGADGSLMPEELYSIPSSRTSYNPQGLAAGDVNGDGFNDLVTTNYNSGLVVVYRRKPEPDVFASPSQLNFGTTYVGHTSSQTLTLSNEGLLDLDVGTIALTGPHASEFQIRTNNCSGNTLMTSDNCTVTVEFSPESSGVKDAILTINSNDPGQPNLLVGVSGTAVLPADIRQPISSIDFGAVNLGDFVDRTTTIFNDGGDTLFIYYITRSSGSPEFFYVGPSWINIPAGGSQAITVRFSPTSGGAKSATFNVNSNDPDESSAPFTVSGFGVSDIYSISGIVTGDVQAGVTVTLSGNASKSTVTDSSGNYNFSELPNGTYSITPSLAGYTFEPPSREVIISNSDVTGVDFVSFGTKPDLVEIGVSNPPATVLVGGHFPVTDTVKNQGDGDAGASNTRYYLSLDTIKSVNDKLLTGSRSVLALAPGATSTERKSVSIPSGTAANTYYLLACSDDTNVVPESNETNNCIASSTMVQVTGPDLVETSVRNPPATVQVGSTFAVTDKVKNQGNADAGASTTQYYLSLDTKKSANDKLLTGSRSVPALVVGATSNGTVSVTVPTGTPLASYYLLACSDDTSVVAEINERNNCKASTTKVEVTP